MADIVNTFLTWFGYQTPDTIATFFDNIGIAFRKKSESVLYMFCTI